MSRSAFFPRRSTRDTNTSAEALLPQYEHSLRDLSPQPTISTSNSPPPSFYRDLNAVRAASETPEQATTNYNSVSSTRTHSTTGLSPERTRSAKGKERRIQFAAPPPPIVQSVVWTGREKNGGQLSPSGVGNGKSKASGGRSGMGSAGSMTGSWIGSPGSRRASAVDPLVGLERREKALQKELQELLDAQSVGLVQGSGGGGAGDNGGSLDGGSDAGSSTPTSRSVLREGKRHVTPVRQPKKKTVGLRGARRGLLRDMGELVGIKNEEGAILDQEIVGREEVLQKVDTLEGRIEGFGQQLRGEANDGEESREIEELRAEERAVDVEIREMEDRLQQMRARKNWLGERISEGVNKREARLSSYRGALREVESEVKEFLRRPPLGISPIAGAEEEGFMTLPPKRRTLGMAREFFNSELSSLKARKTDIEKERLALEDGAKLWQESVSLVMEFEDDLRTHMKSDDVRDAEILKKQVEKMGVIISQLSNALKRAEEKRWNLLICAIGAEVEAFKEGENILRGALGMEERDHIDIVVNGEETNGFNTNGLNEDGLSEEVPNELLTELRKIDSMESKEATDSDDDGPNLAELMVDQGAKEEQEKYHENSLLA